MSTIKTVLSPHNVKKNKFKLISELYEFQEIDYYELMNKRIINVLLICSNYDAFMLEEDGRINEKIFLEYTSYNLRYPPQFTHASSSTKAFELLEKKRFDLVVTMLNVGEIDPFNMAYKIKEKYNNIPVVLLTPFSREVSLKLAEKKVNPIDYVFCWLGDTSLLLAIIKLLEDRMNAKIDIEKKGIQAILLVEDSIRYYSSYLPTIYQIIIEQTQNLVAEGLNPHEKNMRMRARPKILIAKSFEEAIEIYEKYKHELLGIISDIAYPKNGKIYDKAGIELAQRIRKEKPDMPILLQTSDNIDKKITEKLKVTILHKYSKTLLIELREYIRNNYGFGDFIFRNPDNGAEITRAKDLEDLVKKIKTIDINSLIYHTSRNHFSKWLKARALFSLSEVIAPWTNKDFKNHEEHSRYLLETIKCYLHKKSRGVIANKISEYAIFTRLGEGQLGGKGRGIAFIDHFLQKNKINYKWEGVTITIPKTFVLTTDLFDRFMDGNNLYSFAMSDAPDSDILEKFSKANLPEETREYILEICNIINTPLAVRSSSLLEDSQFQPFAGVYSTIMIPNNHNDKNIKCKQLEQAIKSVYASVFFKESKAYMAATSNMIDEEKMAIVIQELIGRQYENHFYTILSGVARSINFYPIPPEKSKDGIVNIAFGFGKTIVDGGKVLRFCPNYPTKILQLSQIELALQDTQKEFYALDLTYSEDEKPIHELATMRKLKIREAEKDGTLKFAASTFDYQDQIIRDGVYKNGRKIITFANILKYNSFPLADILKDLLKIAREEMNTHIEIEFAVNLDVPKGERKKFYFLQIRPVAEVGNEAKIDIETLSKNNIILYSDLALGHGIIDNIKDIVYVKHDSFNPAKTKDITSHIEKINNSLIKDNINYVLIGPGRWGSSDPWLGIPVKWSQISGARLIVETALKDFQIGPSQGTHFFQNLTSFRVGYFTINPYTRNGIYDESFLNSQDAIYEDKYIRHIRFPSPILIKIDGRKNIGIAIV